MEFIKDLFGGWKALPSLKFATGGTIIVALFGGWDMLIKFLFLLMVIDIITGMYNAAAGNSEHRLQSMIGFKGGAKKIFILIAVTIAVNLDSLLTELIASYASPYARTATIMFYIGVEGMSVLENFDKANVPLPAFLRKYFEDMREKGDKGETNIMEEAK